MWSTWQLSPPTTGFTDSDHRQPGWKVVRIIVAASSLASSIVPLSTGRVSSGSSSDFRMRSGMSPSSPSRVPPGALPLAPRPSLERAARDDNRVRGHAGLGGQRLALVGLVEVERGSHGHDARGVDPAV